LSGNPVAVRIGVREYRDFVGLTGVIQILWSGSGRVRAPIGRRRRRGLIRLRALR